MNTRSIFAFSAAALMVMSCGGTKKKAEAVPVFQNMAPQVEVQAATVQQVDQNDVYSTTVQAFAVNNIAPQSAGRIQKINVEVGDFVNAGQIVAEMDKVQYEQARLKYVNDSTEFGRLKSLYEEGGLSQSDYDAAEMALKVSRSTLSNLKDNTILRSPITGVVTARNYDRGDMYAMAAPIYTIQQIVPVKLLIAVSESDYSRIKKGDRVSITADAVPGLEFTGNVSRIYPTIDAASHTVNVEVRVPNQDKALRPGMYAKASVSFGVNNSIVIPDMAVSKQQGSGQKIVFVVDNDGIAQQRFVTVGRHFDSRYEILDGIAEGEQVVVKGNSSLRGGEKVEVK
ncbi:MAG: efflux RND transporter periplasmic adaptor subunit [Bacteroidales bacterium]|nr:efflux RND transporter periplasmic adaptor subunit [Bacteroidales bacterium]